MPTTNTCTPCARASSAAVTSSPEWSSPSVMSSTARPARSFVGKAPMLTRTASARSVPPTGTQLGSILDKKSSKAW